MEVPMVEPSPPEPVSGVDALPDGFAELIRGAIDLHVHGQPDLSRALRNRGGDLAVARLARDYGMSGWVLKSHLWPTMDRAGLLCDALGSSFMVHGSITLNPPVGGLDATVVELAAAHGARVVFLPTWGSAADVARGGYISTLLGRISSRFDRYAADHAVELLRPDGALSEAARDVIDACRALDLALATGHASRAESLAVAEYCAGIGQRLLVTHPLHYVERPDQLRHFVDLGAFVEFAAAPLLHPDGHLSIRDVHRALTGIGPERAVLTTDVFSRWVAPQPECLRGFVEQLSYLGWAPPDLRRMVVDNPRAFLGTDHEGSQP